MEMWGWSLGCRSGVRDATIFPSPRKKIIILNLQKTLRCGDGDVGMEVEMGG